MSLTEAAKVETWTETDQRLMARALDLAARATGQVSPGPLVGCVIAGAAGDVLGEGFYVYEGIKHAETLALEQTGKRSIGATAYISLEPHAHHGRTAPCTDALIAAGIKRVVAPIEDPNPKVSGRGFEHLRSVGIDVSTGLMALEAKRLNEKYLHFVRTGHPFVHLKLATSLDGKIATRTGDSRWITGAEARTRVHELRHEYDSILVGAGTVYADDPLLTDRSGLARRRPLTRIVLDERLEISPGSQLVETARETPLVIFAGAEAEAEKVDLLASCGAEVCRHRGRDLDQVLDELARRLLQSVLIEGGSEVAGKWLEAGLVDKVTIFIAPLLIGGRAAPNAIGGKGADKIADAFRLQDIQVIRRGSDLEITGYPSRARMKDEGWTT